MKIPKPRNEISKNLGKGKLLTKYTCGCGYISKELNKSPTVCPNHGTPADTYDLIIKYKMKVGYYEN